jgi:uncharacterized surface protein with fasciclin (FAS1) repeats
MKSIFVAAAAALTLSLALPVAAQDNPRVGGAAMFADRTIVENAVNSPVHTTLVAAVQAAGLVDTLNGPGPFTVFAPINSAFAALPAGTVDTLLMEENRGQLVKILTAHVVAGNIGGAEIAERAANGGFTLQTVSGDTLEIFYQNDRVYVRDENGGVARVSISDVNQSNGVIHVVDAVLLPN